jgi:hypothetical protein
MELFVKIFAGMVFFILAIFYSALGYETAWNWVMPKLYNLPEITMLQAYVGAFLISLTHQPDWNEVENSITKNLSYGFMKVTIVILVAWIIKTFFL